MLQSLNQIWFHCIFQQSAHCAFCFQLSCCNRFFLIGVAYYDVAQTFFQIVQIFCQTENSHNFGSYGDIVTVFTRSTVDSAAQTVGHEAQLSVIHIHAAFPGNTAWVDVQSVTLIDVVVQHSSQQVVCCADCVHIAGEVQVDVFHRNNLCVTAACSAAFYAKYWTERWLTQCNHYVFTNFFQTVSQTNGGGGFTFTSWGWANCSYQNQFTVWGICLFSQHIVVNFCFVVAVLFQIFVINTCSSRDFADVAHCCFLSNFDVAFVTHGTFSFFM